MATKTKKTPETSAPQAPAPQPAKRKKKGVVKVGGIWVDQESFPELTGREDDATAEKP